jgi:hypothetical protein
MNGAGGRKTKEEKGKVKGFPGEDMPPAWRESAATQ